MAYPRLVNVGSLKCSSVVGILVVLYFTILLYLVPGSVEQVRRTYPVPSLSKLLEYAAPLDRTTAVSYYFFRTQTF